MWFRCDALAATRARLGLFALLVVGACGALLGCSCDDERTEAAADSTKTAERQERAALSSVASTESPVDGKTQDPKEVPLPPVARGKCSCDQGQLCASSLQVPPEGGYPRHVHRCLDKPKDCNACGCLPVDPCFEPMVCFSVRTDRREVVCADPGALRKKKKKG